MTDFSQWDEPMEMLDALGDTVLKASPILASHIAQIHRKLTIIRAEHEQQQKDLDSIFSVLESIEGRMYAKAQGNINDCDF
jgi:hypothetical protein